MNPSMVLACAIFALTFGQARPQEASNSATCEPSEQPFLNAIFGAFCTLQTVVESTVDVIKTPVQDITNAGKMVLDTLTLTESKVLNDTLHTFNQGVGTVANAIGTLQLPGLEEVANTGKKAIHAATGLTNAAVQSLLAAQNYVINKTASGIIGLSDFAGDVAQDAIGIVAETGKAAADSLVETMEAGAEIISSVDETLENITSWSNFMAEVMAPNKTD